jgi:hypothetical protein
MMGIAMRRHASDALTERAVIGTTGHGEHQDLRQTRAVLPGFARQPQWSS